MSGCEWTKAGQLDPGPRDLATVVSSRVPSARSAAKAALCPPVSESSTVCLIHSKRVNEGISPREHLCLSMVSLSKQDLCLVLEAILGAGFCVTK